MTIETIKARNAAAGFYFFSPDTMRCFRSRASSTVHVGQGGIFFVTSEVTFSGDQRRYTVREFLPETATIGDGGDKDAFLRYASLSGAHAAAAKMAATPKAEPVPSARVGTSGPLRGDKTTA